MSILKNKIQNINTPLKSKKRRILLKKLYDRNDRDFSEYDYYHKNIIETKNSIIIRIKNINNN